MDNEIRLPETEYYLNIIDGDLYLVNYLCNRPTGEEWVKIEELCYRNLTSGNAHPIAVL